MTLGAGEQFAGYSIVRRLGSGGMGEVYLAQHPRLPRQDALKVLNPQISDDETFRQRFIQEADLAAALTHPHIVTVYDRGDTDGTLWIAAQFVDGTDAARLIHDRYPSGIPVDEACEILAAIAGALDYAHDRGLLHRDVKPANILLSNPDRGGRRQIYLADFGIARPLTDGPGLTATNTTLGTFAYSAPEQLMGESLDGRADQYALAATAYDLFTGTPPFTAASNPIAVISKHLNAIPPPVSARRPELAALDGVFSRGLAKEPEQRYRTCGDFAAAIAESAHRIAPTSPYSETQAAGTVLPSAPTLQSPLAPPRPVAAPAAAPPAPPVSHARANVKAAVAVAVVLGVLALAGQCSTKDSNPASSSGPTSSPSPTADYATTAPANPAATVDETTSPPTSITPAFAIKPLSVRPVASAFVTTPDLCPVPAPTPPDQTVRICDFTKTAVYELKPEALRVQLARVDSFRNPVTGEQTVQMSMTKESAEQFGQFTAGQVGNQIAFVRAGMVVWGPKITAPIDGQVLQLSGDLTPAQGQEIARLLRDEN